MVVYKFQWMTLAILTVIDPSFCDVSEEKPKPQPTPYQDWDYLVYSQRWPVTACSEWQERSKTNKCNLPKDLTQWTIHGLWPNKIGHEGPFFCDSALHFDVDQLQPILSDLESRWVNIEGNTQLYSFWKHEWNKHGTCASVIPQLNSVTNYFKHGLQLDQQFVITNMLAQSKIVPNTAGYAVRDIATAIKSQTGKVPEIECVVDGKSKESYINEIRICFDKSLDVIDCNVTKLDEVHDDVIMSNCNLKKPVMYLSSVPALDSTIAQSVLEDDLTLVEEDGRVDACLEELRHRTQVLLKLYNSLKVLIWFSL